MANIFSDSTPVPAIDEVYAATRPVKDALLDIVDRADEVGSNRGGYSIEPRRVRRETLGLLDEIAQAERALLELLSQAGNSLRYYRSDLGR